MSTTQQHLPILDIQDGIILLKDGGGALVLQTSAVNFGLLSDREQMAIIASFAQMLNSLSFSIQIVIHSERLDISSYINLLEKAQNLQTNPLLQHMITQYKEFIKNTIKENEVLDKKFYIVIPLYSLELGLTASKESLQQKIKTVLLPRRDQVLRQLNRVGLVAQQLNERELLEVFFDIYNGLDFETIPVSEVNLNYPKATSTQRLETAPTSSPPAPQTPISTQTSSPTFVQEKVRGAPFVVEELENI